MLKDANRIGMENGTQRERERDGERTIMKTIYNKNK